MRFAIFATFAISHINCRPQAKGSGVRLPYLVRAPVLDALLELEAQGLKIELLSAHEAEGWIIERYQIPAGPQLLLNIDPSASAFSYQTCFLIPPGAATQYRAQLAPLFSPQAAAPLEQLGARLDVALHSDFGCLRTTAPKAGLAKVVALEAKRTATLAAPSGLKPKERSELDRLRAALIRTPKNQTTAPEVLISVAGAIDRLTLLRAFCEGYKAGVNKRPKDERHDLVPGTQKIALGSDTDEALLAWPAPKDEGRLALEASMHLLADSNHDHLGKAGLLKVASSATAQLDAHLQLHLVLRPGVTASVAVQRVDRAIDALRTGETTGRQLEAMRTRMRTKTLRSLSGLESRAELAAQVQLRSGALDRIEARLLAIEQLKERDIREAADRLLSQRSMVIGLALSSSTSSTARPKG